MFTDIYLFFSLYFPQIYYHVSGGRHLLVIGYINYLFIYVITRGIEFWPNFYSSIEEKIQKELITLATSVFKKPYVWKVYESIQQKKKFQPSDELP